MSVLAVGLSHQTAELTTLERVAVSSSELGKVLHELQQCAQINEVFMLSTCNRIEVYAEVETFHGGVTDISAVLARLGDMNPAELYDSLAVHYAGAAVEHLFSVACGLESMVVGETQILGQVRSSYAAAREAGTIGRTLHDLVQRTLRVGKRVHNETGLGTLGASVVSEALAAAGELAGKRATILGAGSMGALAASQLGKAGVAEITVLNRTPATAQRLAVSLSAQGFSATSAAWDEIIAVVSRSDVVVACTGARTAVLTAEQVSPRSGIPLVVCDLGLPRDVAKEVAAIESVRVVDLETVQRRMSTAFSRADADTSAGIEAGTLARSSGINVAKETARAAGIVLDEVHKYLLEQRSAEVTPTVAALRKRAAEVVDAELLRLAHRLPDLELSARAEVDNTIRRVVDKLLHAPTVRVKQLAEHASGTDYAGALRDLFGLDPQAPAVISRPVIRSDQSEVHNRQSHLDGEKNG